MSESVSLPALGESVTEGTVTRWLKNIGDRVEVDEPLLEVSTDKVDTEIPSPVAGVLEEILAQEDETVEVGAPLAKIGDGSGTGGSAPAPAAEQEQAAPDAEQAEPEPQQQEQQEQPSGETQEAAQPEAEQRQAEQPQPEQRQAEQSQPEQPKQPEQPQPEQREQQTEAPSQAAPAPQQNAQAPVDVTGNAGYITPLVRRLANQHGVDISTVRGTGVGGRIRKEDVLAAASSSKRAQGKPRTVEVSEMRGTTQPMSRLRMVAAEQAVSSMQSTAQVTTVVEADVTRIAALRESSQSAFAQKVGTELTFLPFFAKAATEALQAHPIINAVVDGEQITYPGQENISITVDTERGMLSPVIREASSLDIAGLASAIAELAERTRSNRLTPDELSGGTFTLADTGSRGAILDTPVVFLPQSAALSTGAVTKRAVVVEIDGQEAIAIRSMVYLSLSYDQRIIDGTDASRFLVAVKERLEEGDFAGDLGI